MLYKELTIKMKILIGTIQLIFLVFCIRHLNSDYCPNEVEGNRKRSFEMKITEKYNQIGKRGYTIIGTNKNAKKVEYTDYNIWLNIVDFEVGDSIRKDSNSLVIYVRYAKTDSLKSYNFECGGKIYE